MKFSKIALSTIAALGLTGAAAQARPHGRCPIQPFVNVGFNIARPVVGVIKPCGHIVPMVAAPIVYGPCIRPTIGFGFNSGPFGFGFSF